MSRRGRSRGPRKDSGTGNSEEDDLGADDVADDAVATLQAEIAASVSTAEKREADALAREKKREEEALTREQAQTARLEQMMAKQAESMVRMIQLTIESSAKEAQAARKTAADREAVERAAAIAAVEEQTRRAAAAGGADVAAPAPASSANVSFGDLPRGDQKRLLDIVCKCAATLPQGYGDAGIAGAVALQAEASAARLQEAIEALRAQARQYMFMPFSSLPEERRRDVVAWVAAVARTFPRGLAAPELASTVSRRFQVSEACAREAASLLHAAQPVSGRVAGRDLQGVPAVPLFGGSSQMPFVRGSPADSKEEEADEFAAHSLVEEHAVKRGRARGSTRIAGTSATSTAAELQQEQGDYILDSMDTYLRPSLAERAKYPERTRSATEFGAVGHLTVARREELDQAADALRELSVPRKKLLKAAGGRPDGDEVRSTVMFALRCAPAEVIIAGSSYPSRERLELLLAELRLVGDSPLPSGYMIKTWNIATWVVRFITGGTDAVSALNTADARLTSHSISEAEARHRRFVYEAFDPRKYPLVSKGGAPTGGENLVWTLYCAERRAEELDLCQTLFDKLRIMRKSASLRSKKSHERDAMLRRYLFGHWIVRLTTGIYHEKPAPIFLCSPRSPLFDLCSDNELGKLFDRVLSGKGIPSSKSA